MRLSKIKSILCTCCILLTLSLLPVASQALLNPVDNETEFFSYLNYSAYPALAKVEAAVDTNDYALAKTELLNYMRERTSVEYLFDALRERDALLAERKVTAQEISTANNNMNHVFNWQAQTRDLGPDIEWNQGSSEWTSVLNRWGWLPPMSWVYLQTQDEKYAKEVIETIWIDWIEDNSLPTTRTNTLGHPWRALEVGIRCKTMLECYHLVLGSQTMTPQNHYLLLKNILEHGMYLSEWCDRFNQNNWQVAGCTGLALLTAIFPEFNDSSTWRTKAFLRIADHLNIDTSDEGWHREYTAGYHINCALDYWLAFELSLRNNLPVDPALYRRHRLMFDVMIRYRFPDLEFIGTGDSGLNGAYSRAALGIGVITYGDGEWRYNATRPMVAQVGLSGLQTFDKISSRIPQYKSFVDPLANFAVMRSDNINTRTNPFSQMVFFDTNNDAIAHRHQDNGQVVFFAYNRYLFADGGSWLYNTPEHTTLTQTRSHNVVMPGGNFIGYTAGKIDEFETTPGFDYSQGTMNGGAVGKWTRQILYVRPEYVIVVDKVETSGTHKQYWQFPVGSNLSLDPVTKSFKTTFATNYLNTFGTVQTMPLHPEEIIDAQFETGQQGSQKNQRGWLTFTGNPAMRETVLLAQYPNTQNPAATLTSIDPLGKTRAEACGFNLTMQQNSTSTRDVILLNHVAVIAPTTFGTYATDARMAYARYGNDSALSHLMIRNGKSFEQNGLVLFSAPQMVVDMDVYFSGSRLTIQSNPTTGTVTLNAPGVDQVLYNGQPHPFSRSGDLITLNLDHGSDRLALNPSGQYTTWIGSVNRFRVNATDNLGHIDSKVNTPVTLSSNSPAMRFSSNNFLTTSTKATLSQGTTEFWFKTDTPGTVSITASAAGLQPATLPGILVEPMPTPPPPPSQIEQWGNYK